MKHSIVGIILLLCTIVVQSQPMYELKFEFKTQQQVDSLILTKCFSTNMEFKDGFLHTGELKPGYKAFVESGIIDFQPDKAKYPKIHYTFYTDIPTGNDDTVSYTLILIDLSGHRDTLYSAGINAPTYFGEFGANRYIKEFIPNFSGGKYKIRIEFAGNTQHTRIKFNQVLLLGNLSYYGGCQPTPIRYQKGTFRVVRRLY